MYYGARYYDPALGRFVQADTIVPNPASPQDLNRYAYVRNNPLRYTDPSGHMECGLACPDDWTDWRISLGKHWYGEWDPAEQARNRARAEQASALVMDLSPGAGDVKGFAEVFTGRDLITGEALGGWRWVGLMGLSELRHLRHADEAVGVIKAASRIDPEWLARFVNRTEEMHWIPKQFHPTLKKLYPQVSEKVLEFTEPLERGFHKLAHSKWGTLADSYNDLVDQWLDQYGGIRSLDDFLQYIGELRSEYLDLYEQYLTGG